MDDAQKVAYVMAQAACAIAEIEAMKAANRDRVSNGYSLAYAESDFFEVPQKYGIDHSSVIALFHGVLASG